MNFRMYIIASWAVARDEGITGIAFMAKRLHVVSLAVCSYGPIGEQNNEDHYNVLGLQLLSMTVPMSKESMKIIIM